MLGLVVTDGHHPIQHIELRRFEQIKLSQVPLYFKGHGRTVP